MIQPRVVSLGCRLNTYEAELMREHAIEASLENTIIVNTCTVTAEAERQSRQTVRRLVRENPESSVFVTGCAAQLNPKAYADMDGVDRVIGNAEKLERGTFIGADHPAVSVSDIMGVRETAPHLIDGFDGRVRAFIEIQQGCDHRCTFCIIPFARGPNRSVPAGAVAEQVRTLVAKGFSEVVLTGVDIASYGADLPGKPMLGDLVRSLLNAVPELPRLRLSSLDPAVMDPSLFDVLSTEQRLMPHFHLSLQAMDDMVLKRMKRRHSVNDAKVFIEKARNARPDIVFGADLIAGFPTESDQMFENTIRNLEHVGVTYYHVFPYSERSGTPASRMPAVEKSLRKKRAAALRDLGQKALSTYLFDQTGKNLRVLVEKDGAGFSEHYAPVSIKADTNPGSIVQVQVERVENHRAIARLAA